MVKLLKSVIYTITSLVGSNSSNKHIIIALLLLKKIIQEKAKIIYIDTELSFPISFISSAIEKICTKAGNKEKKSLLENSFILLRFNNLDETSLFFEFQLEKLIDESIKTIVIDNLNYAFSEQKAKNGRILMRDLLRIAKEKNINIMYVNDLYYLNQNNIYSLEITYGDILNEFCNQIIQIGDCSEELINEKYYYMSPITFIKTNYVKDKQCKIYVDPKKYSYILRRVHN